MRPLPPISYFVIPGDSRWDCWGVDKKGIWSESKLNSRPSPPVGYAFSAFTCHSYPIWVNSVDPEIIDQVIQAELEGMGAISSQTHFSHYDFRVVEREADRTLAQAVVIPGEIDSPGEIEDEFSIFVPAALLYSFPRNRIVIWKEMGRYVVAYTREGRLVHFHGFGKAPFSEGMVREIGLIYADLHDREVVDEASAVLTWSTDAATPFGVDVVNELLGIPLETAPKPAPDPLSAGEMKLLPESIVSERENRKKRAGAVKWALVTALAIALLFAGASYRLWRAEKENQSFREKIAIQGPEAEAIRAIRDRWEGLSAALEVDTYPIELFHRVSATLPPKGVKLNYFGMEGKNIHLKGEAGTVSAAINAAAALKDSLELKDYEWRLPSPDTSGALPKFEATGIYRFATGVESQ